MSLDLASVLPQVDKMSESLVEQRNALEASLQSLRAAFDQAAAAGADELAERIERAGASYRGARPTDEAINAAFPPPAHPPQLKLIGADGSQIFPDRHALALYYLINVGSICMTYRSAEPPQVSSRPLLAFQSDELYTSDGGLVSNALISALRDLAEMAELARLAGQTAGEPALALLDNGLLLWLAAQAHEHDPAEVEKILRAYLEQIAKIQSHGCALAGFIDRPRSANLVALAQLALLPLEQISDTRLRDHPYRGLTDRALLGHLLPAGHRSARFIQASPINDIFRQSGQEVQFFYLNPGGGGQIARIELPAWAAENPQLLNLVHAAILEQGRTTGGFPYVLMRAHELALITQAEKRSLETFLATALLQRGMPADRSAKAQTKQLTGLRRQHRL